MGWYKSFSRKFRMALASSGRFQVACECELYEPWIPQEYRADSIVTHINPNNGDLSLYRARGNYLRGDKTDKINDEPGISIHWELICSCKEIGFKPTPTPSPTPSPTQTETEIDTRPTPTPTPRSPCADVETWNPDKIVDFGRPHYNYGEIVKYNNSLYEAFKDEGTELDDIPGQSNNWFKIADCPEIICGDGFPNVYNTDGVFGSHQAINGLAAEGFEEGGKLYFNDVSISNLNEIAVYTSGVWLEEQSKEPFGIITVSGLFNSEENKLVYESVDGVCYEGIILSNGQNIILNKIYK